MQSSNDVPWYLPKGIKNRKQRRACSWFSTAALFIIAKTCKQPKYPLGGEWINKLGRHRTSGVSFRTEKKETIKP